MPRIPTVVFKMNLTVFTPAFAKSPWSTLFGIVIRFERLSKELPTPVLNGEGNFL